MGKDKSRIKRIQKNNQLRNKQRNKETEINLIEARENQKIKAEKRKKTIKFAALISVSAILCFLLVFGISSYFINKTKQQNRLFVYGLVAVQNDAGKWGYINTSGNSSIDFIYDNAFNFTKNKRALVCKDGKYGFINVHGEVVVDFIYDEAISFDGDIAICKKDDKYGTIDSEGNVITEFKYSNINKYVDNYAIACDENYKYGIIDRNGDVVVNFEYSLIDQVNDTYFRYKKSQIWYVEFINSSKKISDIFDTEFQELKLLNNGYFIYRIAGNYGLVNKKGEIIINHERIEGKVVCKSLTYEGGEYLIYSSTGSSSADYKGYIDFDGKIVISDQFIKASNFTEYAVVQMKNANTNEYSVIDKNGELRFKMTCDSISDFKNGKAIFKKGNLYGVVNSEGKILVDAKYKYISNFYDDGYAIFCSAENLYGVLNSKAKESIKATFKNFVIL